MTVADAYRAGWRSCMAGCDGRYEPLAEDGYETPELREAWYAGWQDAMDAEDDEEAEPDAAGYGQ